MMEKITIENFAGIQHAEIALNRINIFTGPQGSGKSVVAKLIYFFKNHAFNTLILAHPEPRDIEQVYSSVEVLFCSYFPPSYWPVSTFSITYSIQEFEIQITRNGRPDKLLIQFSANLEAEYNRILSELSRYREAMKTDPKVLFSESKYVSTKLLYASAFAIPLKEDYLNKPPVYIPAARAMYYFFQNNPTILLGNKGNITVDPVIVDYFEQLSLVVHTLMSRNLSWDAPGDTINNFSHDILKARFQFQDQQPLLAHTDGRKVHLQYASSGQQEALSIIQFIKYYHTLSESASPLNRQPFLIEEPEAHLFPAAQHSMAALLMYFLNTNKEQVQLTLTTHSPYFLSALNNHLLAGDLHSRLPAERQVALEAVMPRDRHIAPGTLSAWSFEDGTVKSIMDPETGLIHAEYLDSVSNVIMEQFDALLNLESHES